MRPLGWLLLVTSFVIGAGFLLFPIEESVLGTSVSCGPPIARVLASDNSASNEFSNALEQDCVNRSIGRIILGVIAGTILGVAGIIFIAVGRPDEPTIVQVPVAGPPGPAAPPGWYNDPWRQAVARWWDGTTWTPHTANSPPGQAPTA